MLERSDSLMTPLERDESNLPSRAIALLTALRDHPGEWLDRNQLADFTGKRRLSPNDISLLAKLIDLGVIEEHSVHGVMRPIFVYRAIGKK